MDEPMYDHDTAGADPAAEVTTAAAGARLPASRPMAPRAFGRRAFLGGALAMMAALTGCGGTSGDSSGAAADGTAAAAPKEETPKTSSDPHVQYIKNYRGQNAAALGYTAINTQRLDRLGNALIRLVYVDPSGAYVDPEDEELLKGYMVFDQNLPMNTQVDIVFQSDEKGEEYDTIVDWQTHEEVVLAVKKVGSPDPKAVDMTPIDAAPDEYTVPVRDYVGRNLAECGYVSMAAKLTDSYSHGFVALNPTADDGSYVDVSDKASLAGYVVTAQDVAPNTMITMEPTTATNGEKYDLISSQSMSAITLSVNPLE